MLILTIAELLLLSVLGIAVLYILVFSAAGLFYRDPAPNLSAEKKRIAVLIPAYREDSVIVESASEALAQDYPPDLYDVVVIADSLKNDTLTRLKNLKIKVIEVSFEKSTKAKALNKAMEVLPGKYDIAVILDADNIMESCFLSKINSCLSDGAPAVQGHRVAKNLDSGLAVLDAASEEINNHIFRKGHRVLGLSAALIGSGMAFRYDYFRSLMSGASAVGGFDKELELNILKTGGTIRYLDNALVYDEKVQKAAEFGNQRRRWLSAQLYYFRRDIGSALGALLTRGNLDYFDKAFQFIQPPRVLLLTTVSFFALLFILVNLFVLHDILSVWLWTGLVSACLASFIFSLPASFYNRSFFKALASLPGSIFVMVQSLVRIKGANKDFIHTTHSVSGLKDKE